MRQSIRRAHQMGASTLLHDCREHAAIIRTSRLHREMYACADAVVGPNSLPITVARAGTRC